MYFFGLYTVALVVIILICGLPISPDVRAIVKTSGNPITARRKPAMRVRGAVVTGNEAPESCVCPLLWGNWYFFSVAREIKLLLGLEIMPLIRPLFGDCAGAACGPAGRGDVQRAPVVSLPAHCLCEAGRSAADGDKKNTDENGIRSDIRR